MLIVEIGIKLDKPMFYYDHILKKHGLKKVFKAKTHDIYFTNKDLDNMSENEMKNACIRLRSVNNSKFKVQNNLINDNTTEIGQKALRDYESKLLKLGYKKVFDTIKKDIHYYKEGMTSRVQMQRIKDIGLLVYYDNKDYYDLDLETQRKMLIDELNSYGFNIKYDTLGLDKLRTLYYKKEMLSNNQN